MLIKLPIEVWRDCFDWLSAADRRQLASKFNDIPDVEFSDICQRWLHVWSRNLSLGKLRIDGTEGDPAGASVQIWNQEEIDLLVEGLPIAETALPANIKSFELIEIRCLNTKVLDFLQQMQPLFRNVVLDVDNREKVEDRNDEEKKEATRTTLRHLLPLLTAGVETVTMHNSQFCFTIREMFSDQQFFGLKQIQVWEMFKPGTLTNGLIELLLLWLGTGRDDGQPRLLFMGNFYFYGDNGFDVNALRFIESIHQHFMNATKAVSFFIKLVVGPPFPPFNNIQESTIQNAGTQEQLLVRKPEPNILHIDRCSTGENGQQWMERNHFPAIDQRQIAVVSPKLGSFEQPKVQAKEEEDVNQPGPSKKQKLT